MATPDCQNTLYGLVRLAAEKYTHNHFLHIPIVACSNYNDSSIDLTYRQLLLLVEQCRDGYANAGYQVGQRVALMLANRPAFFVHWFALNALGVSVVPVNAELMPDEIAHLLGHSDCCLITCLSDHTAMLKNIIDSAGLAVSIYTDGGTLPKVASPVDRDPLLADANGLHRECAVLYTSGSTGKPKGCVLTNDYFITSGQWYRALGGLCTMTSGAERLLTPLPLFHMNAMATSTMAMLMTGGCLIQLERFHPSSWWSTVRDTQATIIHYLGIMPALLLQMKQQRSDSQHQVKFGFGAGVNPRHQAPFEGRFEIPLIEAWAMTESGCSGAIIANREPRHVGSCCFGHASPELDVMLVDEQGVEVPMGEAGELWVRRKGPSPRKGFFHGYLKDPQATADTWRHGYLNTGDIARQGEDGQYHFVDRKKNIIRRSGENISCLEVEGFIAQHPRVAQVAVAPVADEIRGEEVMALIVINSDGLQNVDLATDIMSFCLTKMIYYKAPGYLAVVSELPLTASQKPRRAELKILCQKLLQTGQYEDLRAGKKRPTNEAII
jgi:acyl-CoA synthetase (AMP-forming)/AMP-acid ligase II